MATLPSSRDSINFNMTPIEITSELIRDIERQGRDAYPNECCGVLIGRDLPGANGQPRRIVDSIAPLRNSFDKEEQYHRFKLDGLEYARMEKQVSDAGKMILGFYHSHPDHPATPSQYDLDHAWPFYSYVIVQIVKREPGLMTSWILDEDKNEFVEQQIV